MGASWNMRVATVGPGERINVTPLWFGWADGRVYFYGRGQKIANLRRDPVCTVLVDRNERYPELQGAMFQVTGRCSRTPPQKRRTRTSRTCAGRWARNTAADMAKRPASVSGIR